MYKPPQNSNRVKSIKSKFENIDYKSKPPKNGLKNNLLNENEKPVKIPYSNLDNMPGPSKPKQVLVRQLSDPSKRNIKRTPAFRVDKNLENGFMAKKSESNTLFENKVKQFNSTKGCDKSVVVQCNENSLCSTNHDLLDTQKCNLHKESCSFDDSCDNIITKSNLPLINHAPKTDKESKKTIPFRPSLIKSKSSHDFQYIRSKFDVRLKPTPQSLNTCIKSLNAKENIPENVYTLPENDTVETTILKDIDLSLLYTEPIPKSLRQQNSNIILNKPEYCLPPIDNIYSKSTLQLTDCNRRAFLDSLRHVLQQDLPAGLTDSLKVALSKPLPGGPAPQKPPRTFKHPPDEVIDIKKNPSFLHVVKESKSDHECENVKSAKKSDPKYKLRKLEAALKNNQLRIRKQRAVEVSTTSGEDSDDSLLYRSKSSRSLPKPPVKLTNDSADLNNDETGYKSDSLLADFNCFSSFACHNPGYEKIKEPNSLFFVSMDKDPIYAEPVQLRPTEAKNENHRNSLYYMSTALIKYDDQNAIVQKDSPALHAQKTRTVMEDQAANSDSSNKKICSDNSSLSSFTSDSAPSPTTDDQHAKIRYLINNFEEVRRRTLPARLKKDCSSPKSLSSNGRHVEQLKGSLEMASVNPTNKNAGSLRNFDRSLQAKDRERVADIIAKFQTYQRTMPKYQKPNVNKNTLFYCCLVIEKVQDCAQIKFQFPPNVDVPREIEHLCFPENPDSPPLEGSNAAQTYSLLITSDTGDRTYGYCRRVLPEGSSHCLPLAYCILSKYRAPRFYKKILIELESRHGIPDKFRDNLISQFYHKEFPKPGESITINLSSIESDSEHDHKKGIEDSLDLTTFIHVNKTGEYGCLNNVRKPPTNIFISRNDIQAADLAPSFVSYQGIRAELVLTLHSDTRYEDADLKILHHKLPPDVLLKVFSSLLLERKVVFISSVISELSSCVDSLQSILYPFTWYHTFVPILPESLWDIVESPTPVICGVLSSEAILHRRIENGIVVNLETKSVLSEEKDELDILCSSMQKKWRQFITLANNTKSREYVYSVYLADAYVSVFVCCMKNYKDYIVDGQFLKEQFIANGKTKKMRRFLRMFTETCMFYAFIDASLNNPESLSLFDKKIELYGSDQSPAILEKLIEWNRG